jgi:hypothetical protein
MTNKFWFLSAILMLLTACGGDSAAPDAPAPSTTPTPTPAPTPPAPTPPAPTPAPTPPPVDPNSISLPIEVLGPAGYIEKVEVDLPAGQQASKLYIQCHRCGWRDGTVKTGIDRGAKASVRLNAGAWMDIKDSTVELAAPEKAYGGLSGGFNTTRFTMAVSNAKAGTTNTLEFRFNTSDGVSNGYRILAVNFLDAGNAAVLDATHFTKDDPKTWTAPGTTADGVEGKALWQGKVALSNSPLSATKMKASCSSCHAADGRDLKYFNYSNWSIQERSQFHGLTEAQGKQIATYIRQLDAPAPAQARPWNPPYQPGPGLDAKPVAEWAAGAGLAAVLDSDKDMLPYLFPKGTTKAGIEDTIDIKKTINAREIPVALQLPDWNDWLPHEHPLDNWSDFGTSALYKAYQTYRTSVKQARAVGSPEPDAAADILNIITNRKDFLGLIGGPVPCERYANKNRIGSVGNIDKLLSSSDAPKAERALKCEKAMTSINPWLAVKMWEVMNEFALQDRTASLYDYGEVRGWPGIGRHVFEMASHRSGFNSGNMSFESQPVGSYRSAAWYQMQMILNSGMRASKPLGTQDWFYTPLFINKTSVENARPLPALAVLSQIKMYQNLDTDTVILNNKDGSAADISDIWWVSVVRPNRFDSETVGTSKETETSSLANLGSPWKYLEGYEKGLQVRVTNALLKQYLKKQKTIPIAKLPRARGSNLPGDNDYGTADYVPRAYEGSGDLCFYTCPGQQHIADDFYRVIPRFKALGVDPALINELIGWCKQVWPKGDWDKFRA